MIGRILFGGHFRYNGINHLRSRRSLSPYAGSRNVPKPDLAVTATGIALLVGGTSILLGVKPKLGAAAIIGPASVRVAKPSVLERGRKFLPRPLGA